MILKGESKNTIRGYVLLTLGILLTIGGLAGVRSTGFFSGTLNSMRQRLNEPVISEAQLYGYEIVGKHIEKYGSSDDISYFIDIKDRLAKEKILKHVKTSQDLYEKVKIGNSFDYTLMGKLKVPELKIPKPNSPQPKVRE